ncbi:MAG: hypothetical protein ACYCZV_17360, partial [Acidimicrobiales bacterium]
MSSDDRIEETLTLRMLKGIRTSRTAKGQHWQAAGAMSAAAPAVSARPEPVLWLAQPDADLVSAVAASVAAVSTESPMIAADTEALPITAATDAVVPAVAAAFVGRISSAQGRKAAHHRSAEPTRARRRTGAKAGVATLASAALVFGMAGTAFANAPNPVPPTSGTVTQVTGGSTSVNVLVGGAWTWGDLPAGSTEKSTVQSQCSQRWGVGWAVDWWGNNPTTSGGNFKIVNDAYKLAKPGSGSGTGTDFQDETPTGTVGYTGSIPEGVQGALGIKGTSPRLYFHVGGIGSADPTASGYIGQTPGIYDGFDSALCNDTVSDPGQPDNGAPKGTWQAEATYPSAADVPKLLCVNFYDMHNTATKAPSPGSSDWDPSQDHDNSVQTNNYDPVASAGNGDCFSPKFIPTVTTTSSGNGVVGSSFTDSATLTGYTGSVAGETVSFSLYSNSTCTLPVSGSPVTASLGATGSTLPSPGITVSTPGDYWWQASYPGDSNGNGPATSLCTSEPVVVSASPMIAGHIYNCPGGQQADATTDEVTGGTIGASGPGPTTLAPAANPINDSVPAGSYTMTATAPSGYEFVSCGGTATSPGYNSETVAVPSTGTGTGVFYVQRITTQDISGIIYLCQNGTETITPVTGGGISVTGGPEPITASGNPLVATPAEVGTYDTSATAPPGYQLVNCGGHSSPSTDGSTATETVVVQPTAGGQAIYFAQPVTNQTLSGHIYLCNSDGSQSTNPVTGGNMSWSTGGGTPTVEDNPFGPVSVQAATYDVSANAPSGYFLTACGSGHAANDQSVTVLPNGSGDAVFYVFPNTSQTIAGHIYSCSGGTASSTEVTGGNLVASIAGQPSSTIQGANPMGPTPAAAATYTMDATAPSGYKFVTCGTTGTTINSDSSATQSVVVPAGKAGVGVFYVVSTAHLA